MHYYETLRQNPTISFYVIINFIIEKNTKIALNIKIECHQNVIT